jgi:hypothetical protein
VQADLRGAILLAISMKDVGRTALLVIVCAQLTSGCRWHATPLPAGLLAPYLRIQSALTDDAFAPVAEGARQIATEAATRGDGGRALQAAALKLQDAQTLEAARASFGDLSEALIAFGESTGASVGADNRVALCPMVEKRWIQQGDRIRNPYYGKTMLTCGNFQNTLR